MNHHEEDFLRRAALRKPSETLDARMSKLFAEPRPARVGLLDRPVRIWQLAVACAVCTVAAFTAGMLWRAKPEPPARSVEVRYVLQAEKRPFDVFDWTQYPAKAAPCSVLKKNRALAESQGQI